MESMLSGVLPKDCLNYKISLCLYYIKSIKIRLMIERGLHVSKIGVDLVI